MEILVAVLAFAGALLAAIATVALIRRLAEETEGWLIAWTVAAAALCVSLGVIGVGYLVGFGVWTFKLYQMTGSLIAPLWLSMGLIQLLAAKVPPRFATWLLGIAFTVVGSAIILFDPVKQVAQMGKVLPSGGAHWSFAAPYVLGTAHVVSLLILLGAMVVAGLRWRSGDDYDTDNLHATLVIAPSGIALVGALRFSVPGVFTTALLLVAAAGIWYSVLRPLAPYDDEDEEEAAIKDDQWERPSTGRRAAPEPVAPAQPRRSGLGDLVAEYRGETPAADPFEAGPATGYIMANGADPMYGGPQTGPHPAPQPGLEGFAHSGSHSRPDFPMPEFPMPATGSMPATGVVYPGAELAFSPQQQAASSRPSPSIFGLLTVFTLMDGSGDAFDRLADETVEAVRRGEPDTLIYACHAVKSAPLQRIVYELYRDEVAYTDHQRQPHVERFVNERQMMVLATNVIELNVQAAKVVPLPTALF